MDRKVRWCFWAVLAVAAVAGAEPPESTSIPKSPAFTAQQLLALPESGWITNGGNIFNQRYSPLTLLNRDNVAGLKALWRTGMGSGAGPGNAGQAQILVADDALYLSNGASDVFAMEVETGRILWAYRANVDPKSGNPIGKSSRGVAMGEGKIFVGQLDSKLVALDQRTGKVVWSVQVEPWQEGFSITSAPLYYAGLVITGINGGEMGVRGRLKAYDARTGKLRWVFYTVPGPGERGHETWPQEGDAWTRGGATVWQTPAVDPRLGLIYFSTGNPGPDLHGAERPGDNLFANSIVAIEASTGKYRWHFQQVHHDLWDYDSPNPVVLFDAVIGGRPVKALVEVSKTGWAYILNRENGQPLIGIDEKACAAGAAAGHRGDSALPHRGCGGSPGNRHDSRRGPPAPGSHRAAEPRKDFYALLDTGRRREARDDGRRQLATQFLRPGDTHSICMRQRPDQQLPRARDTRGLSTRQGLHGRDVRSGACERSRHSGGTGCDDEPAGVASGVSGDLL